MSNPVPRSRGQAASVLAPALALVLALAGCATSGATTPARGGASSTATPTQPTMTPTTSNAPQPCKPTAGAASIGALSLSAPTIYYGFGSDYALPDNLPTAPLIVTLQGGQSATQGVITTSRPAIGSGNFLVEICNTSASQSYRLTTLAAKLVSSSAHSGVVNILNGCAFLYSRVQGFGGECASGFSPDVEESLPFPAGAAVGAVVTQPFSPAVTVAPGRDIWVHIGIQYAGNGLQLSYQLGVGVNGTAVTFPAALRTQPTILTSTTRRWAGDYCKTTAMQAQIPASAPQGTYYVCPQS